MANKFEKVMSGKNDLGLLKIVSGPVEDYDAEGLEAAKAELAKRNLSPEYMAVLKAQILDEEQVREKKRGQPLALHWKLWSFFLPGVIMIMFSALIKSEGYDTRGREMVRWTVFGFCFYICLAILFAIIQ